jgi:hypothetical protein
MAITLAAVEPLRDQGSLRFWDAWAIVRDLDDGSARAAADADPNLPCLRGELQRVVDEVGNCLKEKFAVRPNFEAIVARNDLKTYISLDRHRLVQFGDLFDDRSQ